MTPLAQVEDVAKSFGTVEALRGVTLTVVPGEVVGLLGANGAGKTTLIRCLLGLLAPDRGRVAVVGRPPDRRALRQVGYVPQGLGLYTDLSVEENLEFQRSLYGMGKASPDPVVGQGGDKPVGALSLGLQRRVAFVAALAHEPRLLVLDEPTSGVGPLGRARLWDTIRTSADDGTGVIVTTHHLEEAEQCDRLVMLAGGQVVASGSVADIIGGRRAVTVSGGQPLEVLDRLRAGDLDGGFYGAGIRVVGAALPRVREVLAGLDGVELDERPATLEEAFVDRLAG